MVIINIHLGDISLAIPYHFNRLHSSELLLPVASGMCENVWPPLALGIGNCIFGKRVSMKVFFTGLSFFFYSMWNEMWTTLETLWIFSRAGSFLLYIVSWTAFLKWLRLLLFLNLWHAIFGLFKEFLFCDCVRYVVDPDIDGNLWC